jgi:hypothetical protein
MKPWLEGYDTALLTCQAERDGAKLVAKQMTRLSHYQERSAELRVALEELRINANRLCDRQLGGTYEEDCRRSILRADEILNLMKKEDPDE